MAKKGDWLVATTTFHGTLPDGHEVLVHKGELAREDSAAVRAFPDLFKPIERPYPYDVEEATDEPGRKRGER